MKKSIKMFLISLMILCCAVNSFACNKKNNGDGKTLTIRVANMGFGKAWIEEISKAFGQANNCKVVINPTAIIEEDLLKIENDYQMEDMILSDGAPSVDNVIASGKVECLDDVWTSMPEGESKTLEEKIWGSANELYKLEKLNNVEDPDDNEIHYYSVPTNISMGGMAYNKTSIDKVLGAGTWEVPSTTDEVLEIAKRMKEAGHWGFSWSTIDPYWSCLDVLESQYNGAEATPKLAGGYYLDSNGDWKFSQKGESADQNIGKLRMYEALYEMIHKENGYSSVYCSSMTYMQAQASFAGMGYKPADSRFAAFCPNGNWLYEESQMDFNYTRSDVGFFIPVISAIVEKCSFYTDKGRDYYTLSSEKRKEYDAALSEILHAIENGNEITKTQNGYDVSEEDCKLLEEVRCLRKIKTQAKAIIPTNSRNKELAKKFLVFFASDFAGQIYSRVTHTVSPFYYEVVPFGLAAVSFDKDFSKLLLSGKICLMPKTSPFSNGLGYAWDAVFFDSSNSNINTPQKMWDTINSSNKKNWRNLCIIAGLKYLLD